MSSATLAAGGAILGRIEASTLLAAEFTKHHSRPFAEVAVSWPDADFGDEFGNPPDGPWMEVAINWGDSFFSTIGGAAVGKNAIVGVLTLSVLDRPGNGAGNIIAILDILRDLFNRVEFSGLRFDAPSGPSPTDREREGWIKKTVSISFDLIETV